MLTVDMKVNGAFVKELRINNDGTGDHETGHYDVQVWNGAQRSLWQWDPAKMISEGTYRFRIEGHERAKGAAALVGRVLDAEREIRLAAKNQEG